MISVTQEVNRLLNLAHIQKSLAFLSNGLKDPNYTLELFQQDIIGYLKEAQYNNHIPKSINIDEAIFLQLDNSEGTVFVNFSPELENFITDNGNYIVNELQDTEYVEGAMKIE